MIEDIAGDEAGPTAGPDRAQPAARRRAGRGEVSSNGASKGLAIAALILGALGLIAGLGALAASRRRAQSPSDWRYAVLAPSTTRIARRPAPIAAALPRPPRSLRRSPRRLQRRLERRPRQRDSAARPPSRPTGPNRSHISRNESKAGRATRRRRRLLGLSSDVQRPGPSRRASRASPGIVSALADGRHALVDEPLPARRPACIPPRTAIEGYDGAADARRAPLTCISLDTRSSSPRWRRSSSKSGLNRANSSLAACRRSLPGCGTGRARQRAHPRGRQLLPSRRRAGGDRPDDPRQRVSNGSSGSGVPEHALLTNRHHDRHAWRLQEAFGGRSSTACEPASTSSRAAAASRPSSSGTELPGGVRRPRGRRDLPRRDGPAPSRRSVRWRAPTASCAWTARARSASSPTG